MRFCIWLILVVCVVGWGLVVLRCLFVVVVVLW